MQSTGCVDNFLVEEAKKRIITKNEILKYHLHLSKKINELSNHNQ